MKTIQFHTFENNNPGKISKKALLELILKIFLLMIHKEVNAKMISLTKIGGEIYEELFINDVLAVEVRLN